MVQMILVSTLLQEKMYQLPNIMPSVMILLWCCKFIRLYDNPSRSDFVYLQWLRYEETMVFFDKVLFLKCQKIWTTTIVYDSQSFRYQDSYVLIFSGTEVCQHLFSVTQLYFMPADTSLCQLDRPKILA